MSELIGMHWTMLVDWLKNHSSKRLSITCGVSVITAYVIRRFYLYHRRTKMLEQKHNAIKANVSALKSQLADLDDTLLALTELGLGELSQKIASEAVTPAELLHAFQAKALQLYEKGNSGICDFVLEAQSVFERNLKEQESEDESASTRKSPLYGIPISLKETLCLKGYDSTGGLIKHCNNPSNLDCVLVKVLRKAGAIPFVRTTTSQAMRALDGANPVFGDTTNPHNTSRITGGSSAGEAALITLRGAPVGISTDIGGSIRIPAAFCGLASLKVTCNRLSSVGILNLAKRSVLGFIACPGPMARNVDDLAGVMRSLLTPTMFALDPRVPPMPFDENAYNGSGDKKLTIGCYRSFHDPSLAEVTPVVREAVEQAVESLARAGHKIVNFKPPSPVRAYKLYLQCLFADGGRELLQQLSNEPVVRQLRSLSVILSLPNWMKFFADVYCRFSGFEQNAVACNLGGLRNAQAAIDLLAAVREYQAEFHRAWLKAGDLDAVVCPAFPFPAPPVDAPSLLITPGLAYVSLYNLVDYPAGTVLTRFVDNVNIIESNKCEVDCYLAGDRYGSKVAAMQRGSEGLPVVVQVVGKPFCEETVLRVMRIIEEARESVPVH